ncbi:MAG: hypothetical protein PVG44_16180 [Desulfobacterales bacterium]
MRKIVFKTNQLLLFTSFLVLVAMISNAAWAQKSAESKTFVVIGTASMQGTNISTAREKAIEDGLVTAVALMAEELMEVEALVENFPQLNGLLFDQTSKYVKDYKVLTESATDTAYRVIVQATVFGDKISKQLSNSGIMKTEAALPSVLLLIAEHNLEDTTPRYWWSQNEALFESVAEAAMRERLKEAGFTIVDHKRAWKEPLVNWRMLDKPDLTDPEVAELGTQLKADFVIIGTAAASTSTNIMGSAMRSFTGTMAVRLIRAGTGEKMLNLMRSAVTVNDDDVTGAREALGDVGASTGQALAEDLVVLWQQQAGQPSVVEMIIRGTGHLSYYVKFRKALNTISGVEGIRVKEIKPNEATLMVEYSGKAKDLASALMLQDFQTFGINIYEVTQNNIRVELIPG